MGAESGFNPKIIISPAFFLFCVKLLQFYNKNCPWHASESTRKADCYARSREGQKTHGFRALKSCRCQLFQFLWGGITCENRFATSNFCWQQSHPLRRHYVYLFFNSKHCLPAELAASHWLRHCWQQSHPLGKRCAYLFFYSKHCLSAEQCLGQWHAANSVGKQCFE